MTLSERMRQRLGSVKTVQQSTETIHPIQRRIKAYQDHIKAIRADRFYDKVADGPWINQINNQIRGLRKELKTA